jgi:hypothetical protein
MRGVSRVARLAHVARVARVARAQSSNGEVTEDAFSRPRIPLAVMPTPREARRRRAGTQLVWH